MPKSVNVKRRSEKTILTGVHNNGMYISYLFYKYILVLILCENNSEL
jgi:hypothetical protein